MHVYQWVPRDNSTAPTDSSSPSETAPPMPSGTDTNSTAGNGSNGTLPNSGSTNGVSFVLLFLLSVPIAIRADGTLPRVQLYLYTFLITLLILLGVSVGIVARSLVLRRRFRCVVR